MDVGSLSLHNVFNRRNQSERTEQTIRAMATPAHLLHHLLRPQPPSSFFFFFLKPTISLCQQIPPCTTSFTSFSSLPIRPVLFCNPLSSSSSPSSSLSLAQTLAPQSINPKHEFPVGDGNDNDNHDEDEVEVEVEAERIEQESEGAVMESPQPVKMEPPPSLTVKEKKELSSYAHSLGKKLKSQLVGKSGVTASVASSFVETLESNELLKVKIHRTCPGELPEVVQQLEKATGSVVVGQIGRSVILYRPSLTKLKAEEKRIQNRRIFVRKERTASTSKKGPLLSRISGSSRRGSSRI